MQRACIFKSQQPNNDHKSTDERNSGVHFIRTSSGLLVESSARSHLISFRRSLWITWRISLWLMGVLGYFSNTWWWGSEKQR